MSRVRDHPYHSMQGDMVCTLVGVYMVIHTLMTMAPPHEKYVTHLCKCDVRGPCTDHRHRLNLGHALMPLPMRRCLAILIISAMQQEGFAQIPPHGNGPQSFAPAQNNDENKVDHTISLSHIITPRPRLCYAAKDIAAQCLWFKVRAFDSTRGYPGEGPTRDIRIGTVNTTSEGSLTRALRTKGFDDFAILCVQEHHLDTDSKVATARNTAKT